MNPESKEYILKVFDTELIRFRVAADEYGRLEATVQDVNESKRHLFPTQLLLDASGENIISWMKARTIPKNRQYVYQILATANLKPNDTLGIIDICKGLSVNDSYWLDDGAARNSFDQINLFENRLDETLAIVAYTGYTASQKHKIGLSTEWTTSGQYPKAWRRIDGGLYLFKTGTEGFANAGMEPYSEYFAAQVAEKMGLSHVPYDLQRWKGKLASVCPLLNSRDVSFVPFWIATNQSTFPANIAVMQAFSEDAFDAVRSMIVFDALICNVDRHGGNYGILRDNHTGEFLEFAPLFDHNRSLFAMEMETDFPHLLEKSNSVFVPACGNLSFQGQAGIVMGAKQHEQIRKLIGFQFTNHPSYPVPENRLAALNDYIAARTRELMEIPVADETVLRRNMEKEFEKLDTPVPILKNREPKGYSLESECRQGHSASHDSGLNCPTGRNTPGRER